MIDIAYLEKIKLVNYPRIQKLIALLVLTPNYKWFQKVDIQIEGLERIPKNRNVIFAMNHTDRFNYWPLQYRLNELGGYPYTTVWVKGKYYRNKTLAKVLDLCNLIPVPSMKYLIEEFFACRFGRRMSREEYRAVKDLVDGNPELNGENLQRAAEIADQIHENFIEFIKTYYTRVMDRVAELSRLALFEKKLNLIIFPEGTRSTRLLKGRTGLAQLALNTETPVIPIGCNNCEQIYPGSSPFAKSGRVVYRVGSPLSVDGELKRFRIPERFKLFSDDSKVRYKEKFESVTRIFMERINDLLDERYRR